MVDRYFEDFAVGATFVTNARTVTEADIVQFACLTGDFHPVHTDAEFAKMSIFGQRVAHGLLGICYAVGMINRWDLRAGTNMAFIHFECNFLSPTKIGDTIHCKVTIVEKKDWKHPGKGVIVFALEIMNQRNEIVAEGKLHELVVRRQSKAP
jgi:acyl dehydratase